MSQNQTSPRTTASLASFSSILLAALALGSAACVTVNVNFPESAVQKATDDYVRDLYRAKEKGKTPAPETSAAPTSFNFLPAFDLIASAHAEPEANIKVNTDKALKIKDRLASRVEEVIAQKRAGVLGETNDGLLELKGADKVKPLLKKKLEALVSAENADRNDLYSEVAAANGIAKGRIKDIQKSFARSFQAESPSGTWAQDSEGKWAQKP